ncbi:WD40 repeat domain-containing protein [Actinobacillus equuli subsp. haemolyticus]|uniref:WD40 repeat domain-containing protein n=1 Tax=Actinobacillus equuli TaxID=718 RepID=UPI00244671C7|nr:WD40 repeat domain-containing protein [Actinobacillus equuli]WGE51314.1 WD40 repeat domain-containing protein [Actinobacillus equuli subsp. haemolyticus]
MNIKINTLIVICVSLILSACSKTDPVISLGVSTDGRYVISAHASKNAHPFQPVGQLVLWDIEKKEKKILSKEANAFSATFIPESHEFMWQDAKDTVYIQNVSGQVIERFSHFKTEGHQMSADKSFYLSANTSGKLYKGHGENMVPIYTDTPISPTVPYNLSIAGGYFLSVGSTASNRDDPPATTKFVTNPVNPDKHKSSSYDGVTLWDKNTLRPVARLWGNNAKTTGLLSPNGRWVITGDENLGSYMWSSHNLNQQFRLARAEDGIYNLEKESYDRSQLLPIPDKFKDKQLIERNTTVAYAFVTETEFVQFGMMHGKKDDSADELAPLYTVGDPWIKAYVEIGNDPAISVNYYQRKLSISSSPTAHILVTGQATGGGINVYKYHPDQMELEKIWVAD